jgi:hypothetical protein
MEKLNLLKKALFTYLEHGVQCSYLEYTSEKKRLKATLTGITLIDGIETTYKRKRRDCAGDYIGFEGHNNVLDLEFKLHLHPLSYLTKEIEINGEKFKPFDKLGEQFGRTKFISINHDGELLFKGKNECYIFGKKDVLECYDMLSEWHFDIFGLIPEGLAIDINTLK